MSSKLQSASPGFMESGEMPDIEPEELPTSMRKVSLVERIELGVSTSRILPNAIVLGDIDNDPSADIEFAVGNGDGDLFIFKGKRKYAWKRATGLGCISCLALGDLLGSGHNVLLVVTTEGNCHLFDVSHLSNAEIFTSKPHGDLQSTDKDSQLPSTSDAQRSQRYSVSDLHPGSDRNLSTVSSTNDPNAFERRASQDTLQVSTDTLSPLPRTTTSARNSYQMDSSKSSESLRPQDASAQASAGKHQLRDDWVSNAPLQNQPATSTLNPTTSGATTPINPQSRSHDPASESLLDDPNSMKLSDSSTHTIQAPSGSTMNSATQKANKETGRGANPLVHSASTSDALNMGPPSLNINVGSAAMNRNVKTEKIEPVYRWFVAQNGTCAIVADVDEDGENELVIGSSSRVVYAYAIAHEVDVYGALTLKLKLKNKWNIPGQASSLSISRNRWGRPVLVVAQHGGNYTTIDHKGNSKYREMGVAEPVSHLNTFLERNTATQIRHIPRQPFDSNGSPQDPVLMAMVNLDGSVKLQEENSKMLWTKQTEHQLFALSIVDITGDGHQEMVTCAWDGTTFIYDQFGNCVQFQFEERVAAFAAGNYSVTKDNQQPCLFFLTFSDHLYIYHNLPINSIPVASLIATMGSQFEAAKYTKTDKTTPWTRAEKTRLIRSLLDPSKFDEQAALAYKAKLEQKLQDLSSASGP